MNAADAKVPNVDGDWQSIDIFLFSNGQQYSPPRKYHLQCEELNWWDATLNQLARSHYGIQHPLIYLYTTDGRKVEGPLELKDGMAYVAVEPPDPFIDAGYEKYLIRATKSWEKRQARKASPLDITADDKTVCEHDQPCCLCPEREVLGAEHPCCFCPEKEGAVGSEPPMLDPNDLTGLRAPDGNYVDPVLAIAGVPRTGEYGPKKVEQGPRLSERGAKSRVNGTRKPGYGPKAGENARMGGGAARPGAGARQGENAPLVGEYGPIKGEHNARSDENGPQSGEKEQWAGKNGTKVGEHGPRSSNRENRSGTSGTRIDRPESRIGEQRSRRMDEHGSRLGNNQTTINENDARSGEHEARSSNSGAKMGEGGPRSGEYAAKLGRYGGRPDEDNGKPSEHETKPGGYEGRSGEDENKPGMVGRPGTHGGSRSPSVHDGRTNEQGGTESEYESRRNQYGARLNEYDSETDELRDIPNENRGRPGEYKASVNEHSGEYGHKGPDHGARSDNYDGRAGGNGGRRPGDHGPRPAEYGSQYGGRADERGGKRAEHGGRYERSTYGSRPGEHSGRQGEHDGRSGESGGRDSGYESKPGTQRGRVNEYGRENELEIRGEEYGARATEQGGRVEDRGARAGEYRGRGGEHGGQESRPERRPGTHEGRAADYGRRDELENREGEQGRRVGDRGNRVGEYGNREGDHGSREGEHGTREVDRRGRMGEHGNREGNREGRVDEYRSREGDRGGRTGEHGNTEVDRENIMGGHGSRQGDRGGRVGVHGNREGDRGGRVGEHGSRQEDPVEREGEYGIRGGDYGARGADRGTRTGDFRSTVGEHRSRGADRGGRAGDHGIRTGESGAIADEFGARSGEPGNRVGGAGVSGMTGISYISEAQQHIRKSSISTTKPSTENKKRLSAGQHPTFRKPSPCPILPVPQKRSDDKKPIRNIRDIAARKMVGKSPAKSNGAPAGNIVGKLKPPPKIPNKRIAPPAVPPPTGNFNQTVIRRVSTSLTKIIPNNKCLATDSAPIENVIDDKEIIVVSTNLYRNPESEITSLRMDTCETRLIKDSSDETQTEPLSVQQSITSIAVNEEVQTYIEQLTEEVKKNCNGVSTRNVTRSNSKRVTRTTSQRDNMVATDDPSDDNYIAIINKGDVLNLKLNIEVRNGDPTLKACNQNSRKSRSLTNVMRTDKGSQISFDDAMIVHSKSLQSLLNSECFRGTGFEGRPKVLVVQCACCGRNNMNPPRFDPIPSNDNKKYFVFLPNGPHEEDDRCDCDPALRQSYAQRTHPKLKTHSSSLPIRKTYSNTSLERITTVRETVLPCQRRDVGMVVATCNSTCQTEEPRSEYLMTKHKVSITEDQNTACNFPRRSTSQISMSVTQQNIVVDKSSSCPRVCIQVADSHAQTDWCNVLLEARRHEDGRYSFHLPPLHVLRYYIM